MLELRMQNIRYTANAKIFPEDTQCLKLPHMFLTDSVTRGTVGKNHHNDCLECTGVKSKE